VNNKAALLKLIILVAASVTCCLLLGQDLSYKSSNKDQAWSACKDRALSSATVTINFEDYERSLEKVLSAPGKNYHHTNLGLAERYQSNTTKVSLRYLIALQHFQSGRQDLVLDLRKLLI